MLRQKSELLVGVYLCGKAADDDWEVPNWQMLSGQGSTCQMLFFFFSFPLTEWE